MTSMLSKDMFNFSDSLFNTLGYNKHPSISQFDIDIPNIEKVLEENKEKLFRAKSNLGFCRKLQNLLFDNGLNICYTHNNPYSDDNTSFFASGYYINYWDQDHHIDLTVHASAKEKTFAEKWNDIKFELFATICHETIHLLEAKKKIKGKVLASCKDLMMSKNLQYERYYLSDTSEISAFAFQILMEERYYGESNTLARYYSAFRNKKLSCAKPVLFSLHDIMESYKKLEVFQ